MLYAKEQRAINELYEKMSIKPKNMTTGKQIFVEFLCDDIGDAPFTRCHLVVKIMVTSQYSTNYWRLQTSAIYPYLYTIFLFSLTDTKK
ncbi:hypothetical protein LSPH24S_06844 [Lysinibacillus sphaericus]